MNEVGSEDPSADSGCAPPPQTTCSHQASQTSTWALSSKWWSALARPPCCVPPVATQIPRSPGTRTSCPSTPAPATGGSSSFAQVRGAQGAAIFVPSATVWVPRVAFLCFLDVVTLIDLDFTAGPVWCSATVLRPGPAASCPPTGKRPFLVWSKK